MSRNGWKALKEKKISHVTGQGYPHALHIPENTDKAMNSSRSKKNRNTEYQASVTLTSILILQVADQSL